MVIKFFATFRRVVGENEVEIPAATDLQQLLITLCQRYGPGLREQILQADGQLRYDVIVLINGRAIEHLQGLSTPLQPADVIAIFPRMAGG